MRYFLTLFLLILTSCATSKYPHNYFTDCEKKFSEFNDLSACALKEINKDCKDNSVCKIDDNRFVNIIKRLNLMVNNKEISENEAMFRYLNLIDYEESKYKSSDVMRYRNYNYSPNDFYIRGIPNCYFSRYGFCY